MFAVHGVLPKFAAWTPAATMRERAQAMSKSLSAIVLIFFFFRISNLHCPNPTGSFHCHCKNAACFRVVRRAQRVPAEDDQGKCGNGNRENTSVFSPSLFRCADKARSSALPLR